MTAVMTAWGQEAEGLGNENMEGRPLTTVLVVLKRVCTKYAYFLIKFLNRERGSGC